MQIIPSLTWIYTLLIQMPPAGLGSLKWNTIEFERKESKQDFIKYKYHKSEVDAIKKEINII